MRLYFFWSLILLIGACSQPSANNQNTNSNLTNIIDTTNQISTINPGAWETNQYIPLLKNKNIGLVVNQTSTIEDKHLIDTLLKTGIKVKKIFALEHGIRGKADAGEHINSKIDKKTKLPIISLYGKNKKPTIKNLSDIDILIFDIQDVGVRFFTYISSMHYIMETCAENNKKLIILDRPNPNGDYVDGPILDKKFRSFVGMHPIPVVHGLTVGELAMMINGEYWLKDSLQCDVEVIKVKNYTHSIIYSLPIKPSPNLPTDLSIRLYPSLCFFEATIISIGRGTYTPFQVIGYPDSIYGNYTFTPTSIEGMSKRPKHQDKTCFGIDLQKEKAPQFTLSYLIDFYKKSRNKDNFFNRSSFLNLLAGTNKLEQQIKSDLTEKQIKASWEPALNNYKQKREKYLLYDK